MSCFVVSIVTCYVWDISVPLGATIVGLIVGSVFAIFSDRIRSENATWMLLSKKHIGCMYL